MKTRIIAGAALLVVMLCLALFAPDLVFAVAIGLMASIGSYELLYRTGLQKQLRLNIYSAVMAFCVSLWSCLGRHYALALIGMFVYYVLLFAEMLAANTKLMAKDVLICLTSGVVMPFLFSALIRVIMMEQGRYLIYIPFVMAFLSDTGAYFVGVFFGKHKLCPVISPKKTVEGLVGGVAAAVIGMIVYALIMEHAFHFEVNYLAAVIYGLLGSLAGVFGDLSLSVIKRQTGIKDYGNLIPGHGGILDRFDSVLITAPLTEALLLILPILV